MNLVAQHPSPDRSNENATGLRLVAPSESRGRRIDLSELVDLRSHDIEMPSLEAIAAGELAQASPMLLAFVVVRPKPAEAKCPCHRPVLTLLFCDIVHSTRRLEATGDASWRRTLEAYRAAVRRAIGLEDGHEIDTAGDGFFSAFDQPAQALRAARAIRDAVAGLGVQIRIGLHAGECDSNADGVSGVAVHIAARVAAKARPGEILVSRTVRDLVFGSSLRFSSARRAVLKGLSQEFRLFVLGEAGPEAPTLLA